MGQLPVFSCQLSDTSGLATVNWQLATDSSPQWRILVRMRGFATILLLALAGCQALVPPLVTIGALDLANVATFHRSGFDLYISLKRGRDCSVVHLEQGKPYCTPLEAEPASQAFCTRTLGSAECFADPATLADHPSPLGDAPALTAAQEQDRLARWPNW
jgi:hypothetical protein